MIRVVVPGVLELGGGFLLDAEDDVVGAADADGGVALADGFEGILDLEEVAVGGENGDCSVVPCHCDCDLCFFLILSFDSKLYFSQVKPFLFRFGEEKSKDEEDETR